MICEFTFQIIHFIHDSWKNCKIVIMNEHQRSSRRIDNQFQLWLEKNTGIILLFSGDGEKLMLVFPINLNLEKRSRILQRNSR